MDRTAASVGINNKVTGIESALDSHLSHEIGHVKFDNLDCATRHFNDIHL